MKRLHVGPLIIVTLLMTASPAADATPGAEIRIQSASGCTAAHGPGDWNKHCIDVRGAGLHVDSVEGYLVSTSAPYFPTQICGVDVKVWGTEAGGYYFERKGRNDVCGLGSSGVKWQLNMNFSPGSQMCAQTSYEGNTPGPALSLIHI